LWRTSAERDDMNNYDWTMFIAVLALAISIIALVMR
jgi:hypothetical protein